MHDVSVLEKIWYYYYMLLLCMIIHVICKTVNPQHI
jgi:hypothetical protein